jgi:hypothetical protein
MDFIERLFHIAPDGGDGTFEAALFVVLGVVVTVAAVVGRRFFGAARKRTGPGC